MYSWLTARLARQADTAEQPGGLAHGRLAGPSAAHPRVRCTRRHGHRAMGGCGSATASVDHGDEMQRDRQPEDRCEAAHPPSSFRRTGPHLSDGAAWRRWAGSGAVVADSGGGTWWPAVSFGASYGLQRGRGVRRARPNQRESRGGGAQRGATKAVTFRPKLGEDRRSPAVRCGGRVEGSSRSFILDVGWSGEAAERAGVGALFGGILELGGENRGVSVRWRMKREGGGVTAQDVRVAVNRATTSLNQQAWMGGSV
jgi:hypothetical protein